MNVIKIASVYFPRNGDLKKCEICKRDFVPHAYNHKYCGYECKKIAEEKNKRRRDKERRE